MTVHEKLDMILAGSGGKTYISIDEFTLSSAETYYNIGFKPKIVLVGANCGGAFAWYNQSTNKCYYKALTSTPYNVGSWIGGDNIYKYHKIDNTGFSFSSTTYAGVKAIIIAFG